MRELERPIGQVYRRLRVRRFLSALVWSLAGTLLLAAILMGVDRLGYPVPGPDWLPLAIAGGASFLIASLVASFSGPSRVDAAVAIDREFGLNERLGTALTLPTDLRETQAGRAVIADTIRHLKDLDVAEKFPLGMPRRAWLPLLPAMVAAGLVFAPTWTTAILKAKATETKIIDSEVISEKAKMLVKKTAAKRQEMNKEKFAETEKLLAQIEKAAEELAKAPPAAKDKALMELNKLTDAVQQRQKQVGSPEQLAKQLQQLKDLTGGGPGEKFAKELSKGDFGKASLELKKLQEKMASGKMTEPEKKQLQAQLAEMKKQLNDVANMEQRKKQLEDAKKNGGLSEEQYKKEMDKLNQQSKQMDALKQLAEKLEKVEQALDKGDIKKAAEALGMSKDQLSEMAEKMQELETLDGAMAELQEAKDGMTGEGMNQLGEKLGMGKGSRESRNRQGLGKGRGEGDRPEAKDDVNTYQTQVKQQIGKGKAVFEQFVPPTGLRKGESKIEMAGEVEAATALSAEALTNQKVPKDREKHIRGYFDRISKGQE